MNSPPPRLATRLLRRCLPGPRGDEMADDLADLFALKCAQHGRHRARLRYWLDVLSICARRHLHEQPSHPPASGLIMWHNYWTTAQRYLRKRKGYSLLNLTGLAVGFAVCLLMLLYVQEEYSYDRFHPDADRIYRLGFASQENGAWRHYATNSWAAGDLIREAFASVEQVVRFSPTRAIVTAGDQRFHETSLATVEPTFFDLFAFDFLRGDPATALAEPGSIVLSETMARKYFGGADPVGQPLDLEDGAFTMTVTGVLADMPPNSHFHFDFLLSSNTFERSEPFLTNVGWTTQYVYVKLAPGTDPAALEAQFPAFVEERFAPFFNAEQAGQWLLPLTDIHLHGQAPDEIAPNGDAAYVLLFLLVALLTLGIAVINYMNLATARATERAREVGMRKVLGAERRQLIVQFLSESVLLVGGALVMALGLVALALPAFNAFAGKALSLAPLTAGPVLAGLVGGSFALGLLAGLYPAFVLAAFQPLRILKGAVTQGQAGIWLRQGLVVTQFTLSIALLIGAGLLFQQLDFLQSKDVGYQQDDLVFVPMQRLDRAQYPALKSAWLTDPRIAAVGAATMPLTGQLQSAAFYQAEGVAANPEALPSIRVVHVDHDFFDAIQATFSAGRSFSEAFPTDAETGIILNEAAVAELGWTEPVGKWFELIQSGQVLRRGTVVGVVEDFHYQSLHREIVPIAFMVQHQWLGWMYARVQGDGVAEALAHLEAVYTQFQPDRPFTYSFVSDDNVQLYTAEARFLQVFALFTALAMGIACLGIFGLATFLATQRTREIGIRKALGASAASLVGLLTREFVLLVAVAFALAVPVAYFAAQAWLGQFPYRVEIGVEVFLLAGLAALTLALLSVAVQALRAAHIDPVRALRYE